MFGSKQSKEARLQLEINILSSVNEISVEELAQRVGVPKKTIYSDLTALENLGFLLQEHKGRISVYQPA